MQSFEDHDNSFMMLRVYICNLLNSMAIIWYHILCLLIYYVCILEVTSKLKTNFQNKKKMPSQIIEVPRTASKCFIAIRPSPAEKLLWTI